MIKTGRRLAGWLVVTLLAQLLTGCFNFEPITPESTPLPGTMISSHVGDAAQATIDAGERQLLELSRRSTEVSLDIDEAADDAARATRDWNQREQMELDYQATVISLNITQAAATQQFLVVQTQIAGDATSAAGNAIVAATRSAKQANDTQTAQAQAVVDGVILQTVQAEASLTAYPLTATPFAETQAALLMEQYDQEQRSFIDNIVIPLVPIVAFVDLLLIIFAIIVAYRRYIMPVPWPLRLRLARFNSRPITMIDGVILSPDLNGQTPSEYLPSNRPKLIGSNEDCVEIINAAEPPVAHWVAEVEQQLTAEGRLPR